MTIHLLLIQTSSNLTYPSHPDPSLVLFRPGGFIFPDDTLEKQLIISYYRFLLYIPWFFVYCLHKFSPDIPCSRFCPCDCIQVLFERYKESFDSDCTQVIDDMIQVGYDKRPAL